MINNISNIRDGQDYLYNNFNNYEIEDINSDSKECYIFFSSNGIYENSFDKFYKTMIEENRYEWKSIAKVVKKRRKMAKILYVRDVYKKYYIYGINQDINSISKLLDKLKEITRGYKITTIGISSGGYMAALAGGILGAEKVFTISGQFEIESCIKDDEKEGIEGREYFDIVEMIKSKENIKIYYFCPIGCEFDKKNYDLVKNIGNIKSFVFNSKLHADTVYPFNFPDIFCAKSEKLDYLARKYDGKVMNKISFALNTLTWQGIWEFIIRAMSVKFNITNMKKIWDVK